MRYREHCCYRMEADALHTWIVSASETVESLARGVDSLPKEQLELILIKLDVIFVTYGFVLVNKMWRCSFEVYRFALLLMLFYTSCCDISVV